MASLTHGRSSGARGWLGALVWARLAAVCLGPPVLVLEHGFGQISPWERDVLGAAFLVLAAVVTAVPLVEWGAQGWSRPFWLQRWPGLLIVLGTLAGLPVVTAGPKLAWVGEWIGPVSPWEGLRGWCQVAVGLHVLAGLVTLFRRLAAARIQPAVLLVGSFAAVIATGTVLLMLPRATTDGRGAPLLTALFSSTSATCVTGLTVVPTGQYFTRFGQVVILILIQVGGLGVMTLGAFLALVAGQGLRLQEAVTMQEILNRQFVRDVDRMVLAILVLTVVAEALGALLILGLWPASLTGPERLFYSLFHAVSAFCNAGISLTRDSFTDSATRWQVWGVLAGLIVIGGLGFTVVVNIGQHVQWGLARGWRRVTGRPVRPGTRPAWRLQSKLVLVTTAVLLVLGAAGLLVLESGSSGRPPLADRVAASVFQSVSARTAGFSTVEIGSLSPASLFLLIGLMFVGASPGSTGGGVKTATAAVIVLSLWSVVRGRPRAEGFRRTVPSVTVIRAMTVVILFLLLVATATFILTLTERADFLRLLFEATSAAGTVGLSTGITPQLTDAGRVVIMVVMFVGRVGPLTLLLALSAHRSRWRYEYASEEVAIG